MKKINCDNKSRINSVEKIMRENYAKNHNIQYYAELCNLERKYFISLFKQYTGVSPLRFRTNLRIAAAKELLLKTNKNNEAVANSVGYTDPLYFGRIFKKYTGMSPGAFRKKGALK